MGIGRRAKCGHKVPHHSGPDRVACEKCCPGQSWAPYQTKRARLARCGHLVAYAAGTRPRQCDDCKPARQPCAQCGASLAERRSNARFCSLRCSNVSRGTQLPAPLPARRCALDTCGKEFVPNRDATQCCSEAHGKALWRQRANAAGYKNPKQPWGGAKKAADQRRRARKVGAPTEGHVVAAEIMVRDGWRCGLCRKKINRRLAWPHPLSASLDHIVPLSRNGAHSPANVQAAHLVCNTAKSNRGSGEQLALLG